MNDKTRIFLFSIGMYVVTLALALTAAWQHVLHPALEGGIAPLELTAQNGFIFIGVFVVFTFLMVRFIRFAHVSLSFFLVIALIAGTRFILSAWIPLPYDILGAVALAVLYKFVPRVIVHDTAIILGISGLGALLGQSMTPIVAMILLAALSIYDIVSVYRTRHMVTLANHMLSSGAVFGFLVPANASKFFMRTGEALDTRSVMMLGSGDIGLPLVLATSAISQSVGAAVMVGAFSIVGVSIMHWLFAHQERPAPMAALPPIAVSAILGYALAIALGI